jgi:hypothetical protein
MCPQQSVICTGIVTFLSENMVRVKRKLKAFSNDECTKEKGKGQGLIGMREDA